MPGLPFPINTSYDREASNDYGTPFSNVDEIPIDPALAGPEIDPTILTTENGEPIVQVQPPNFTQNAFSPASFPHYAQDPRTYHQGPQGDPFAPQPPASYLPLQEDVVPPTKPPKRRRKPRREEECGFCQGDDSKNKDNNPEAMVTCTECGRSGHPTCMELGEIGETLRSYDWKCMECKNCEVCKEKGDDERILFCDFCDRGWHMDCLQPPLEESPPGKWHCPYCPPVEQGYPPPFDPQFLPPSDLQTDIPDPTNPYPVYKTKMDVDVDVDIQGEGKGKVAGPDEEGSDDAEPEEEDESTPVPLVKRRKKASQRKRATEEVPSSPVVVRPIKRMRIRVHSPAPPLVVRLRIPPKGKGKEREEDEETKNIFDEFLPPEERDTSRTTIDNHDKIRFEKSRYAAEEKLAPPPPPTSTASDIPDTPVAGPSRPLRSGTAHQLIIPPAPPTPSSVPSTPNGYPPTPGAVPPTPTNTNTLRIRTIRFGQFDIQTWYDAPFPEEYANIPDGRLWICEFCLKYMKSKFASSRHRMKCKARHPPGDEIYRDGTVSIFEVDGRKNKIYCQNLCLLSRMFLDHKSLFYDVEPFLFYVMTEVDDVGARFVGYFSKEKRSPKDYNVSCIMTLPVRQRQGWGGLLIDFSYLLSKKEGRSGSPEKPLSGLGAIGYKNYWTLALTRYLATAPENPRLEDISKATSMTVEDIHSTLTQQNMIFHREVTPQHARPTPGQSIKFPRGRRNGIARKHLQRTQTQDEESLKTPFAPPTHYDIRWDREKVKEYLEKWEAKGHLMLKPERLKWTPFVLARTKNAEVLQTPTGEAGGSVAGSSNVVGHDNGGMYMSHTLASPADGNDARNQSSIDVQSEAMAVQDAEPPADVIASPASRLFDDDPYNVDTPIPKKSLRVRSSGAETPRTPRPAMTRRHTNGYKAAVLRSSARRVPSALALAPPIEAEHPDESSENVEQDTPVRARRQRSRGTHVKPPETSTALEVSADPTRMTPPESVLPRKRRRVETPESEHAPEEIRMMAVNGCDRPDVADDVDAEQPPVERRTPDETRQSPHNQFLSPQLPIAQICVEEEHPPVPETRSVVEVASAEVLSQEIPQNETAGSEEQVDHVDVKSEDIGTPLTGSTGRHSVPSDDTVFTADSVNVDTVGGKVGDVGMDTIEVAPETSEDHGDDKEEAVADIGGFVEVGADTSGTDGDVQVPISVPASVPEVDSDLDAEGEPDDEIEY